MIFHCGTGLLGLCDINMCRVFQRCFTIKTLSVMKQRDRKAFCLLFCMQPEYLVLVREFLHGLFVYCVFVLYIPLQS